MTGRLFLALWPDVSTGEALRAWQAAIASPQSRLTPACDLHLTLHFLGALDVARLPDVLAAADVRSPPIALTLSSLEAWKQGLRVAVAHDVPPALVALHAAIGAGLRARGLPVEAGPYRPHVTLARRAGAARVLAAAPSPIAWTSAGHALAMRDGPHYRVLQRWPGGA